MIDETNYLNIEGWMVSELGLKGKDLMAYAIIYGFSQDGCGWYYGGRNYIADWLGCNVKTAGSLLSKMTESGLLRREEVMTKNGRCYRYQALRAKNAPTIGRKAPQGEGEKRPTPRAKNAPITTKGDYNSESNSKSRRFTPPTLQEVEEYAKEKGYDLDCEYFWDYWESVGWKRGKTQMKDWKATLRNWVKRESKTSKPKQKTKFNPLQNIEEYAEYMKDKWEEVF